MIKQTIVIFTLPILIAIGFCLYYYIDYKKSVTQANIRETNQPSSLYRYRDEYSVDDNLDEHSREQPCECKYCECQCEPCECKCENCEEEYCECEF